MALFCCPLRGWVEAKTWHRKALLAARYGLVSRCSWQPLSAVHFTDYGLLDEKPMYVIRLQRGTATLWLTTITPQQWGGIETGMRFHTRGEARRAAVAIKLSGDWSIDPVPQPSNLTPSGT